MQTLVVLTVCLAAVNAYKPVGPYMGDNVHAPGGSRVVGGTNAKVGDSPWQISLNMQSWFGTSHICGGSLLNARTVITAAHCCDGATAAQLFVKFGGLDRTSLANNIAVTDVKMHPSYSSSTIDNDYCVLKLAQDAKEDGNNVKFIKIASSSPATGTKCTLTGWGKTSGSTSALPTQLQIADMEIWGVSKCGEKWDDVNKITKNMICAAAPTVSGCNGDSGGPLTVAGELVGVVSWGANGCPPDTTQRPTVYADPAETSARKWISDLM